MLSLEALEERIGYVFQDNALRRIKTGFAKNSAENRFHGIGKNRRTMCAARLYLTFPHVEEA